MECCYDFEVGGVKGKFNNEVGYWYVDKYTTMYADFDGRAIRFNVEDFIQHDNPDYFRYILDVNTHHSMHYSYGDSVWKYGILNIIHDVYFTYKGISRKNIMHKDGVIYILGDKKKVEIVNNSLLRNICDNELEEVDNYHKLILNRKSEKQYKLKSRIVLWKGGR